VTSLPGQPSRGFFINSVTFGCGAADALPTAHANRRLSPIIPELIRRKAGGWAEFWNFILVFIVLFFGAEF